MSRSSVTILILAAALIATNAWWLYQAIDVAVTGEYQAVAYRDHRKALTQALAIIPLVARPDSKKEEVLAAAMSTAGNPDSFEKEGYIWVGRLGLRFSEGGRLIEAVPAWSPY